MDIVQIYVVAAGSALAMLILLNLVNHATDFINFTSRLIRKYLTYPIVLHRHIFAGPWSPADILVQSSYIAVVAFCLQYKTTSLSTRSGYLALGNSILLYAGPHLSFLADVLGLYRSSYYSLHKIVGLMSYALVFLHIGVELVTTSLLNEFSLHSSENIFAIIGGSALALQLICLLPIFRKLSYETFLRMHQALAVVAFLGIWQHTTAPNRFSGLCVYMFLLFFATFLVQVVVILYRNGVFHGRLPRAKLAVEDKHTVAIKISLSRQVNVAAGQYISIWIPSISLHSFLQSHPFVVSNWTEPKQDSVDLLVNSQRGFTQNLYNYAKGNKNDCLVLFSGPHGVGIPIDRSETVIMIASGFGMAALLPHIRQLIYSYNAWKCSTRRIRIIWEIEKAEEGRTLQKYLNLSLVDDTLDLDLEKNNGSLEVLTRAELLTISIFIKSRNPKLPPAEFGKRATAHGGRANLESILWVEAHEHVKRDYDGDKEKSSILVIVSGTEEVRDELRPIVRKYVDFNMKLVELEYQPNK